MLRVITSAYVLCIEYANASCMLGNPWRYVCEGLYYCTAVVPINLKHSEGQSIVISEGIPNPNTSERARIQ